MKTAALTFALALALALFTLTACKPANDALAPSTTPASPANGTADGTGASSAPAAPVVPAARATLVAAPAFATTLPDHPARNIVLGRCTICHDETYLPQQRLDAAGWEKTITKMQTFGAPVTKEEAPVIAAYLARSFAIDAPDEVPPLVPKPPSGLSQPATRDARP